MIRVLRTLWDGGGAVLGVNLGMGFRVMSNPKPQSLNHKDPVGARGKRAGGL